MKPTIQSFLELLTLTFGLESLFDLTKEHLKSNPCISCIVIVVCYLLPEFVLQVTLKRSEMLFHVQALLIQTHKQISSCTGFVWMLSVYVVHLFNSIESKFVTALQQVKACGCTWLNDVRVPCAGKGTRTGKSQFASLSIPNKVSHCGSRTTKRHFNSTKLSILENSVESLKGKFCVLQPKCYLADTFHPELNSSLYVYILTFHQTLWEVCKLSHPNITLTVLCHQNWST